MSKRQRPTPADSRKVEDLVTHHDDLKHWFKRLTPMQLLVLWLRMSGYTGQQIADKLHISKSRVFQQLDAVRAKKDDWPEGNINRLKIYVPEHDDEERVKND
jgi:DNA-binding NarL/FixJ family response regulator